MELMVVARALHMAATVLLAGAFAFRFFVMPRPPQPGAPTQVVDAWLRVICALALPVALLSWIAWLVLVGATMSGRPVMQALDAEVMSALLLHTTFGHAWTVRLVLFLLLAVTTSMARRAMNSLSGGLAAAALLSLAWTGHALSAQTWQLAADALHAGGAGLWLGALLPLLLVLGRARSLPNAPAWQALAESATTRFSALGVCAVVVLVATGLANSARMVGSPAELAGSTYGRLLAGKLALFAAILTFAAINRFVLTPRLRGRTFHSAVRPLWRNAFIELLLGAAILGLVAVLGITPPAVHQHAPGAMEHEAEHAYGMHR